MIKISYENKMIYVTLRGNLGNQLFQYALARKFQKETKQTICLNYYHLKREKKKYNLDIDKYKLNENVIFEGDRGIPFFASQYNIVNKTIRKIFPNLFFYVMQKFGIYVWLKSTYKEIKISKHKNYYIDGYYQCDKYFEDVKNEIIKELIPKDSKNKENDLLYERILNTQSVCVTIRRGDYISNEKYKKIFFVCDKDYFYKSIAQINKMIKKPVFFIFSDDIEWAKQNISIKAEVYYESGKDTVEEKIRLMSSCKNFIISNSTFSWWAQYLGKNKNKIVIAPSKWYVNGEKTDIYQNNWSLIEIER